MLRYIQLVEVEGGGWGIFAHAILQNQYFEHPYFQRNLERQMRGKSHK